MAPSKGKTRPWVVSTQADVAAFFGVSRRTVIDWSARGMPGGRGRYDLSDIFRWWRSRTAESPGAEKSALAELEVEEKQLELERKRLRLMRERGELILRKVALAEQLRQNHIIRSRLEAIPAELASTVPSQFRAEYLPAAQHKIRLALLELASHADDEDDGPTAPRR